jgi:hypothetical protein
MVRNWCWLALSCWIFSGCAGYRVGPTNGDVAGAKSIQVDFFGNETFEPRLSEAVCTALRRTLQQDGTYRLNTKGNADIVLRGVIKKYQRQGISYEPTDVITPRDFQVTMVAKVTVTERSTGRILMDREVGGRTTIRMGPDLASAERQAVPMLAQELAWNVTGLLVDGAW